MQGNDREHLNDLSGVRRVEVDLVAGRVNVDYDADVIALAVVKAALEGAGYGVKGC